MRLNAKKSEKKPKHFADLSLKSAYLYLNRINNYICSASAMATKESYMQTVAGLGVTKADFLI